MGQETLDKEVKVRIPGAFKRALKRLADERHLKVADVAREALRNYIDQNEVKKQASA